MDALKKQLTESLLLFIETKNDVEMTRLLSTVNKDGFIFDAGFFKKLFKNTTTTTQTLERLINWGVDKEDMLIGCVVDYTEKNEAIPLDLMKFLLDSGANPNCVDREGLPPLFLYCESSTATIEGVELLLKYGANPKILINGYSTVLKKRLELGGLIDGRYPTTNNTYLHRCCRDGDYMETMFLLDNGANPNIKNNDSQTALDMLTKALLTSKQLVMVNCYQIMAFYKHGLIPISVIENLHNDKGGVISLVSLPRLYIDELYDHLDKEALVLLEGGGGDELRAKVDVSPSIKKHTNPFTCPYHLLQECFEQTMKEMMSIPQCSESFGPIINKRIKHMTTKCKLMANIAQNSVLGRSVLNIHAQAYESDRKKIKK